MEFEHALLKENSVCHAHVVVLTARVLGYPSLSRPLISSFPDALLSPVHVAASSILGRHWKRPIGPLLVSVCIVNKAANICEIRRPPEKSKHCALFFLDSNNRFTYKRINQAVIESAVHAGNILTVHSSSGMYGRTTLRKSTVGTFLLAPLPALSSSIVR